MNTVIEQLKSDLASVALDIKPLAEKSRTAQLSDDESTRFDDLVARAATIKAEIDKAAEREEKASAALALNDEYNRPAGTITRGVALELHGKSAEQRDLRTPGQKFVESEQLKRSIKSGSGLMREAPVTMDGFFQKAVISSGTLSGSMVLPDVQPGIYRAAEAPLRMRDVLMNLNTNSDTVTVMQESAFTNSAAEVAEATANNGSGLTGGVKPESDLTFTEVSYPVRWIGHWTSLTRQNLEDAAFLEPYINQRLLTGIQRREDAQFLNGNGTAPNLTGILQTSGIQTLDSTYFTANPVATPTANVNLNKLRRAMRVIEFTALATPTFAVINPVDAENIDTLATTTGEYLIGGPLAGRQRRLWGLQVVESANIAAGTALVGDGTMAAVVDRNQARIYTTDSHADYFIRNLFVILAEERVALAVFRPSAFAKVTLS
jgi:HK97 family phage major capsid protein